MKYLKITIGIFIALAASRFVPHPPNFTSLLALSFYIPAMLGINYIPALFISFFITDLIIGMHNLTFFTWGSIILIGFILILSKLTLFFIKDLIDLLFFCLIIFFKLISILTTFNKF